MYQKIYLHIYLCTYLSRHIYFVLVIKLDSIHTDILQYINTSAPPSVSAFTAPMSLLISLRTLRFWGKKGMIQENELYQEQIKNDSLTNSNFTCMRIKRMVLPSTSYIITTNKVSLRLSFYLYIYMNK